MDSKSDCCDSLPVSLDFDIPFIDEKKDSVPCNGFGNLSLKEDIDEESTYPEETTSTKQEPISSQNISSKSFPTSNKISSSTPSTKLSSSAKTKVNGGLPKKNIGSKESVSTSMVKSISKGKTQQSKLEVKKANPSTNKSLTQKLDKDHKETKGPLVERKTLAQRSALASKVDVKKPVTTRTAIVNRQPTATTKIGTKEHKVISDPVKKPNSQLSSICPKPTVVGSQNSKINKSGPNQTTPRPSTASTASNLRTKPISKSETSTVGKSNSTRSPVKSKESKTSSAHSVKNNTKENPVRSQVKSKNNITSSTTKKITKDKELTENNTERSIKPSQPKIEAKNKLDNRPPDVKLSQMSLEVENLNKLSTMPAPTFNRQISTNGDQLITFKDALNPRTDFDQLERMLGDTLDEKEKQSMKDLRQYLVKKEDAWLLDHHLIKCIGALLEHRSLNPDIRVKLLRLLAAGALRDDFWSFLQMDRKERQLMKYPNDFEDLSVEEQKAVALFLCNNFSSSKGAEWLLYGSPWPLDSGSETSNVKITSKVAAYSLVSYTPSLQDYGSALIYNIAMKEAKALSVPVGKYSEEGLPTVQLDYGSVSDKDIMSNSVNGLGDTKFVTLKVYNDVTVELCIAVLKFIKKTKNPNEEILYRCVKSLLKFSLILKQDLLSCIAMVQTDLDDLVPGRSARIDELWSQLRKQLVNNSDDVQMEM